ncbi:hypothetical protein ACF1DY_24475 [Streptomyces albus]
MLRRTTRTIRTTVAAVCAAGAATLALTAAPAQATASPPVTRADVPPAAGTPGSGAAHTAAVADRHTGPEIHRFLRWFYGQHGPGEQQREHFVSDLLKRKQAENPGYDVLLCAQNTPRRIDVGPVTVAQSAGVGWATVTAHWSDGTTSAFTAYVALDSHPIELHDVVCGQ